MGDRCSVQVTIRREDFDKLVAKFDGDADEFLDFVCADDCAVDSNYATLDYVEANYANWDELEDLLKEECVEYNKMNSSGSGYDAGVVYFRRNGRGEISEAAYLTESELSLTNFLSKLMTVDDDAWLRAEILMKYRSLIPIDVRPLLMEEAHE